MSSRGGGHGDHAGSPRTAAYLALLGATSLGTVSSTIMSAPINDIMASLGTDPQGIVLAVSAFTVAMVAMAPAAGWISDRMGPRNYLVASLLLMIVGHLAAACAPSLTWMVVARTLQGVACTAIPPTVQLLLASHWPERRRQAMAAWASAIGLGQAVGPPVGGAIAEILGWRWTFGGVAAVVGLAALVLARTLPEAPTQSAPRGVSVLVGLSVGAGLVAIGLTGVGQGWILPAGALTTVGAILLGFLLRPWRRPPVLGEAARHPAFGVGTLTAGTAMGAMGITLVSVPVYLGTRIGLGPGPIGLATLALALGMMTFPPVIARVAARQGVPRTLSLGLLMLLVAAPGIGLVEALGHGPTVLAGLIPLLTLMGAGIAAVQSMSALVIVEVPGRSGWAMGIHSMGRFIGLCLGYAWVALTIGLDQPLLLHGGTAVLAVLSLAALMMWRRATR